MPPVTSAARRRWWQALTLALATGYLVIGLLSATPSIRWPFVIGALLVAGGLATARRNRPLAWAALVVGAVVPAVVTWWSVAGPVTGVLILGCGAAAIRSRASSPEAVSHQL